MSTPQQMLAAELRDMALEVVEVIDHVISARTDDSNFGAESFEEALSKLRSMKMMLNYEAGKLDPEQAVAS